MNQKCLSLLFFQASNDCMTSQGFSTQKNMEQLLWTLFKDVCPVPLMGENGLCSSLASSSSSSVCAHLRCSNNKIIWEKQGFNIG
jgi:hypothetical protein